MLVAGIDVGSVATKCVLLHAAEKRAVGQAVLPTGWNAREAAETALSHAIELAGIAAKDLACIAGTGYGRVSLPFADKTITEISCHARGAAELFPASGFVIDIGGQDSKAIGLEPQGSGKAGAVKDFVMNDKCAAGTGRFLQVLSGILGMSLDELSHAAGRGSPVPITSMCAVFAETEIVSLLARGEQPENIAAGVYLSIVRRVCALARRIAMPGECAFTGGLAVSKAFGSMLEKELGVRVNVPESPQSVGALGAALIAADMAMARH